MYRSAREREGLRRDRWSSYVLGIIRSYLCKYVTYCPMERRSKTFECLSIDSIVCPPSSILRRITFAQYHYATYSSSTRSLRSLLSYSRMRMTHSPPPVLSTVSSKYYDTSSIVECQLCSGRLFFKIQQVSLPKVTRSFVCGVFADARH